MQIAPAFHESGALGLSGIFGNAETVMVSRAIEFVAMQHCSKHLQTETFENSADLCSTCSAFGRLPLCLANKKYLFQTKTDAESQTLLEEAMEYFQQKDTGVYKFLRGILPPLSN